jgi:hypothetical protein
MMSAPQLTDSALSVRARCSRMIWEAATLVGVLLVTIAALFGFLTGEPIQIHAISFLVLGIIPAAAVLLFAGVLVLFFRFLGSMYDVLTAVLPYGFASCICLGAAFRSEIVNFREWNSYRGFVLVSGRTVQVIMAGPGLIGCFLKSAAERTQIKCRLVVREIVLEWIWARKHVVRLAAHMPLIAGWPVRTSARLLLKFMN